MVIEIFWGFICKNLDILAVNMGPDPLFVAWGLIIITLIIIIIYVIILNYVVLTILF